MKKKNYNFSNISKYNKDHKSQVSCLPGPMKNSEVKTTGKLNSVERQARTDIFFSKKVSNFVLEKSEKKPKVVKKNIPSDEKEVFRRKSARPDHIRNPFESQIFLEHK